jgi:hypothetical protein
MNRLRLRASRLSLSLILLVTFCVVSSSAQTSTTSSDGWVVLAISDYAALRHAASPADPEPVAPPVEATLRASRDSLLT